MTQPAFEPNTALSGDLFSQNDLSTGFNTDIVPEGEYTLALKARLVKKPDNIIYVEGTVQAGPDAGKNVKVFNVIIDANTTSRGNQKGIALANLKAVGIDLATLNLLAKQTGAAPGNLGGLYEALVPLLDGRVINAYLGVNTYNGKNGEVTEMRIQPGKASLVQAPAVAVGGVPTATPVPVAAPVAAPVPVAAAPVAAPAPAVVAPVAVAAPAPAPAVAVAPAVPAVPVVEAAPVAAPAPVVAAPVPAPVAPAPAPAPVAPAGVSVAEEPNF